MKTNLINAGLALFVTASLLTSCENESVELFEENIEQQSTEVDLELQEKRPFYQKNGHRGNVYSAWRYLGGGRKERYKMPVKCFRKADFFWFRNHINGIKYKRLRDFENKVRAQKHCWSNGGSTIQLR